MENKVSVIECRSYEQELVDNAVKNAIDLIGGIDKFVKEGQTVALKVNLVTRAVPEKCVTTHPAVVEAVVKLVHSVGGKCVILDSPGGPYNAAYLSGILKASQMNNVAERTGAKINDDYGVYVHDFAEGKIGKQITVLSALDKVDVIFNLCKLKSHGFTGFTNAVKNMFGAIPGLEKVEMHGKFTTLDVFSHFLYDIWDLFNGKIALSISDAIMGMEGAGPSHGTPISVGAIIASENPLAVDVVGCKMMNIDPKDMPTNAIGIERGYLNENFDIEVLGDEVSKFVKEKYDVPKPDNFTPFTNIVPKFLQPTVHKLMTQRPVIPKKNCKGCNKCHDHCPMKAITMTERKKGGKYAKIDYQKCIRCYCCQELCPFGVVKIKSGFVYKLVHKNKDKRIKKQQNKNNCDK
ncbi:MAG: DUF362 domain-containing protein [Clostridia bacterium]|nr:DUF362 domain-containing protein [Clostridia bacterium]